MMTTGAADHRGSKLWLDEPEPCRKHWALVLFAFAYRRSPGRWMPGLLPLFRRVVTAGKPSPPPMHPGQLFNPHAQREAPALGGTGASEAPRSWIGLGGAGLGVTYPTAVFNVR